MVGRSALTYPPRSNRGIALLLVVSVISLLTVVIVQFGRSMRTALVESSHYQDRAVLAAAVQSGTDIGIAVLRADRVGGEVDSLLEPWALIGAESLTILGGDTELQLTIENLDGRLPINGLVPSGGGGEGQGSTPEHLRGMLQRLLLSGRFAIEDEGQAREIVDSLVDWLDSDDNESPYGAESSYYESLEKPYGAANTEVEFIDELLLVKGITAELLYGNDEMSALAEYITVHGDGRQININTAPVELLLALDERLGDMEAELIEAFRREPENEELLADVSWYQTIPGWPGDIVLDQQLLTTGGSFFRIISEAVYRDARMIAETVIRRENEQEMEILSFRID
ncbi:MAG: type II secretion system minor pseudopilin GspK [Desulfobulbaceae bacterium]|nr:type II secretion system minor pseudopilin GspK [Desulfobulbaceae bacterium]